MNHWPHRRILCSALLLLAVAGSSAGAPLADGLHRTEEGFVRVSLGEQFRVDPSEVSVKFIDPSLSFEGFLNHLNPPAAQGNQDPSQHPLAGLQLIRSNRLGWHDLRLPENLDLLDAMAALHATGLVLHVEESVIGRYTSVPNDPQFSEQWALNNTSQTGGTSGADMRAIEAWQIQTGSRGVIIAVVDSGTNYNHVDLAFNMWKNEGEIEGNGVDDDGNGFIDDYHGWNFASNNNNPITTGGHGTQVAGTIGAVRNNATGISGLAAGNGTEQGCLMMPLAVGAAAPNGSVLDDAIIYAADNGARIISLSLSVSESIAINEAIEYATNVKGCLVICAAGNNGSSVSYPARLPLVMAIGATDHNDNPASFTNPGPQVEVAAPGVSILTTTLSGGYQTTSGTSFAAPYTSALAGLIWSQAPCLTNDEVRQLIIDTADDVHIAGFDNQTGWGRINAAAALAALANACCPADANGDGFVDLADLNIVLAHFGEGVQPPFGGNPPPPPEAGDLNGDGQVDLADLNLVLAGFGSVCN